MAKKKASAETPPATVATEAAPTEAAPKAADRAALDRSYTVLARRYRPQQFADLVGQEPVAQSLINALQSGRVAHAYLFTGARGVGKTSTARILAKALNCEKGPTITPCDQCDACKSIAVGEDIDVLEIDGASNRGIDEVREIRSNVQFRPSRGRHKIYIIDEVHMLTGPAFNALLKTLEEPPQHVKFIFATTEAQKIPITILSRCQRFDFAGISITGLVDCLRTIVASEGMQADDEALELIARRAGGSMRDAQSLLDQLLAFSAERLTVDQVHRLLGTANEERVMALAAAVLGHDAKQALELLGQAVDQGLQLTELLDQLIEYWRDLMVVRCAGLDKQALSVGGAFKAMLKEHAEQVPLDTLLAGLDVLASAKNRTRGSSHGRALIEMALVRLSRLEDLVSLSQLAQALAGNGAAHGPTPPATPRPAAASPTQMLPRTSSPPAAGEKKNLIAASSAAAPLPLTAETIPAIWQQVLEHAGFMLAGELRKATNVAIFGPNCLVARYPPRYNLPGDTYLDGGRLAKVEEILSQIVGAPCSMRIEIVAAPDNQVSAPPVAPAETSSVRLRRQRGELAQHPLVGRAMEVLGGQIVQADEDFGQTASPGNASSGSGEPGAGEEQEEESQNDGP